MDHAPESLIGIDSCKAGWIAVWFVEDGRLESGVFTSFSDVTSRFRSRELIAIDIPIELMGVGARACDALIRQMLAPTRSASVFPAPIRPILNAKTQNEASGIRREIEGKGVSAQAFGIYAKVRQVDSVLRRNPQLRYRTFEVHPEASFTALNGGEPMLHPKRSIDGHTERLVLLKSQFGEACFRQVRDQHRRAAVGDDDILDALVGLWTARRIGGGIATVLPDPPVIDEHGLPMAIWM